VDVVGAGGLASRLAGKAEWRWWRSGNFVVHILAFPWSLITSFSSHRLLVELHDPLPCRPFLAGGGSIFTNNIEVTLESLELGSSVAWNRITIISPPWKLDRGLSFQCENARFRTSVHRLIVIFMTA
jgi:hypothetical protein